MKFPILAYGTPRKLPKADSLPGRVVVLDVAFAATVGAAAALIAPLSATDLLTAPATASSGLVATQTAPLALLGAAPSA